MGNADRQLQPLDSARSGHNRQLIPANLDAPDIDDRAFLLELTGDELPRSQNRQDAFHSRQGRERLIMENAIVADHADDRPFLPCRQLGFQAEFTKPIDNMINFPFRCIRSQHDNHDSLTLYSISLHHCRQRGQERLIFLCLPNRDPYHAPVDMADDDPLSQ